MFEAVENIDFKIPPGAPIEERVLGTFESENDARDTARAARHAFLSEAREDYAWWLVREVGHPLARWIADSESEREYILDLRSGQLVEA